MNSQASNSNQPDIQAFDLLDRRIQRWIWDKKWSELRDIQDESITRIIRGDSDIIISAATAGGKTEAAFLPICSQIVRRNETLTKLPSSNLQALYVSPLKALINDQHDRLDEICSYADISVFRWHGDVFSDVKRKFMKSPNGILLITPESLEAILINAGSRVPFLFSSLSYIVIDELHAFIGNERGSQLQSILHRICKAAKVDPLRIGLSATLSDMTMAAEYLRPQSDRPIRIIQSSENNQELLMQIRGYELEAERFVSEDDPYDKGETFNKNEISAHIYDTLNQSSNLIFANDRSDVEKYACMLAELCRLHKQPVNFWPHHGSLSKDLREDVEAHLKSNRPTNVVCTNTLEMGIDIGYISSIVQIGIPPYVSSLRQRVGRSGRRGEPAILRIYVDENEITPKTKMIDSLRTRLVCTMAMFRLMLDGWCEPPAKQNKHLSTLIQQILSLIAQYNGCGAQFLYDVLCKTGPFYTIPVQEFMKVLKHMGMNKLIQQTPDGLLLLGSAGEPLVNHYSFYTSFKVAEEYRLMANGRHIGMLPDDHPITNDMLMIFAGRYWRVTGIDTENKVIDLVPAGAGQAPLFKGAVFTKHTVIRQEMVKIYQEEELPVYLDKTGKRLLMEGRNNFVKYGLSDTSIYQDGADTYLFHWQGDDIAATLSLMLKSCGIRSLECGPAICCVNCDEGQLRRSLEMLYQSGAPEPEHLISHIYNPRKNKYDNYVPEDMLAYDYAARHLNPQGAWEVLKLFLN